MAGRKIFNEKDARRCLTAVKGCGGGLAEWAREHGIDGRSLNLWRAKLERRGTAGRRVMVPRLVELVPMEPGGDARVPLLLRVGPVELEVSGHFDEALLRRLVGVLKSC